MKIELTGGLQNDSFILSLRRFLAQRVYLNIMRSNNRTNFIGVVKQINDAIKNLKHNKITTYLNKHQIKWQFDLSLRLWMGDCWQSLIKTMKRCLYTLLKNSLTTVETLTTV